MKFVIQKDKLVQSMLKKEIIDEDRAVELLESF